MHKEDEFMDATENVKPMVAAQGIHVVAKPIGPVVQSQLRILLLS